MADRDQAYVATLASQFGTRRPDLLALAEDELQTLRGFKATVACFIHNQTIALDIRAGLARDLHLPTPEK